MKIRVLVIFLAFAPAVHAQQWWLELGTGVMAYNGDLTQKEVSLRRLRPAVAINLKSNTGGIINLRGGIMWGKVTANDQFNPQSDLKARNLNFTSHIFEANFIAELALFDPDLYKAYPYFLAGVGIFYFNPYSYDQNHVKTYLRPLSTEGQGLPEYPNRKKYALVQPCIPLGMGWKWALNDKWELSYEIGFRVLFTDYLDDVSKTYVDIETLIVEKGLKAAEFAYRKVGVPFSELGEKRGNSDKNDVYFFSGLKLAVHLAPSKKKKKTEEEENEARGY